MRILRALLMGIVTVAALAGSSPDRLRAAEPSPPTTPNGELRVGAVRVRKILFLGNSITLHGPAPNIGWTGNWGMAASVREKDYVHQLLARIAKHAGSEPHTMVRNIADFERNLDKFNVRETLAKELAFAPDVVILAIGENASTPKSNDEKDRFAKALAGLLAELKKNGSPKVLVRSQFWPDDVKDPLLKQACLDAGGTFVDIQALGRDPANSARAERAIEHAGVAGHPGDKGMAAIAEALWVALRTLGEKP